MEQRGGRRQESGQALVIVSIVMLGLLAFLGLIVDLGMSYVERRYQQNAADAAALAGARVISLKDSISYTDSAVKSAIEIYVSANNGSVDWADDPPRYLDGNGQYIIGSGDWAGQPLPVGLGGAIPSTARGVSVVSRSTAEPVFIRMVDPSLKVLPVAAVSDALVYPADMPRTWTGGIVPIAITDREYRSFAKNTTYDLWSAQYSDTYGTPDKFKGLVDFSGHTSSCDSYSNLNVRLECWARYGFDGTLRADDSITIVTGTSDTVTKGLCDNVLWQSQYDSKGYFGFVFLPIFDSYTPASPAGKITLKGFAKFKIYTANCSSGGSDKALGEFVAYQVNPKSPIGAESVAWGPQVVKPVPHLASVQVPSFSTPTATPRPSSTPTPTATATPTQMPAATATSTPRPTSTPKH